MTKHAGSIRQRRRLLNPDRDFTVKVSSEIERSKQEISKYKKNDKDRRQGRKS